MTLGKVLVWPLIAFALLARAQAPTPDLNGLVGTYYNGPNFEEKVLTRTDARISFDWEGTSPARGVQQENFSVRWTGFLRAPKTGTYTLVATTDDGMRIWVGSQKILDEWRPQPPTTFRVTIKLTAGEVYPLRVDYYQLGYQSRAQLAWIPPDQPKPRGVGTLFGLVNTAPKPVPIPTSVLLARRPAAPIEAVRAAAVKLETGQPATAAVPPARPVALIPPVPAKPTPKPTPKSVVPKPRSKPPVARVVKPTPAPAPTPRPVPAVRRPVTVAQPKPTTAVVRAARPRVVRPVPPRPAPVAARPTAAPAAPPKLSVATLGSVARGTTLALPNLYFEQGKPQLKIGSAETLDELATVLRGQPKLLLEIGGHTDNQGNALLNQQLSEQRARRVREYLIQRGVDSVRLTAVGYGGARPVADNNIPTERVKNRRVEVTVR